MMERLLYCILKSVAILPLQVLYVLAGCVFFLLYYIIRYRRRVVADNLAQCFPGKSEHERAQIARRFYRNFADYIFETLKLLHISDSEMERRMQFEDLDIIDRYASEGRSVAVYFSHCFNWEWAPSMTLHTHPDGVSTAFCQVYRPLASHAFDSIMLRLRGRFGSLSLPKATVLRRLLSLRRDGYVTVTGFMSDQKPSHGDPTLPLLFLGRPTAFITGTEELARKLGMAAVYWDMYKISRGHYKIVTRVIADNVADTGKGDVTRQYAAMLQQTIERNPAIWLWTHKRWKIPVSLPKE